MPHSHRKKRNPVSAQKRLEITDDDGWTHVTSGGNARRTVRGTNMKASPRGRNDQSAPTDEAELVLSPAEAPARLTFEELEAQYKGHEEKWIHSETWQTLRSQMEQRIRDSETEIDEEGSSACLDVDGIVCIGLGSPSGFLRDGWVDRRAVSMYQLAALKTIKDIFAATTSSTNRSSSFPVYAQDPVFNVLDRALLESLGVTVVNDPVAFEIVTSKTLLFCPGAERKHLDMLLPSNPRVVLGGPLENTESSYIQTYVEKTDSRVLVPFSAQEHAFWKMRLYFWAPLEEAI